LRTPAPSPSPAAGRRAPPVAPVRLTPAGALALAAIALCAALHLRAFGGAFLGDDMAHLNVIATMDRQHALGQWLLARFVEPLGNGNFAWRPLAFLSYAAEWRVFGTWVPGWRAVELLLHLCNTALVYVVVSRWTLGRIALHAAPALPAAIFAAFPFAGEVTYWPAGRADALAAAFSLLFLATLERGAAPAGPSRQVARVAAIAGALLAKESALPLLAVAVPIDWVLRAPLAGAIHDAHGRRRALRARMQRVFLDLAPAAVAFIAYLAWRQHLFGTPLRVYPGVTLPASASEYLERLTSYRGVLERHPGLDPGWTWPLGLALVLCLLAAAALRAPGARSTGAASEATIDARGSPAHAPMHAPARAGACTLAALAYVLAPALSSASDSAVGDGARNFYVAWIYVALAAGLAAGLTPAARVAGLALVAWLLVAQEGSLRQWQDAAYRMQALLQAVPALAQRVHPAGYALLFVADHQGVALFARNAEAAMVSWPQQASDHLAQVAGMTDWDVAGWREHFADGTVARLKGRPFDPARFAGVFCWSAGDARFERVAESVPGEDFDAWARALRERAAALPCMPGTLAATER
jgi:hypothetical protein